MKILMYLFYVIFLLNLSIISEILAKPNIVKTLPGYPGDLPFSLETGYIGVGEKKEVQLFYYFVESERDVENDPLMVWLTGGPGCSALSGLVFEMGPLVFNLTSDASTSKPRLQQNPYSWTKIASIIFVDSPVGTGFSYATTSEAYYSNDTLQSTHIHDFLRKWLIQHPKFTKNSLYISGDSYSGLIGPIVAQNILQGNDNGLKPKLNLKGIVLGSPLTNIGTVENAVYKYAHRISFVSDELYKSAMISCNGDLANANTNNSTCLQYYLAMKQNIKSINSYHILEHNCPEVSPKPHNTLPPSLNEEFCREEHYMLVYAWADDQQVRQALHIKEGSKGHWVRCNNSIAYEMNVKSSFDYHLTFSTKPLQVLIYSGDQDMKIPYIGTLKWINQLNIQIIDEWRPWFVDDQIAGYVTEFSRRPFRLVFTTIKGGGHTAPEYRPQECLAMLDRWFTLRPL